MNTKQITTRISLSLAIMLSASMLFAQPGGGGGQGLGGTPPATSAPIDGGSTILLAAVAAYAHRKLKTSNQTNKD